MLDMAEVPFPRLHKAVRWASKLHKDTDRDGAAPLPYLTHPLEVLTNLRFLAGETDEEMLCAAVLHDALEDTEATGLKIEKKFGPRVRGLVESVTRREPSPEETAGKTEAQIWKLRSDMLLDEIRLMGPEAQRIKLADRLSNVEGALRSKTGEKLKRYLKQSREILGIIPRDVAPELWDAIDAKLR